MADRKYILWAAIAAFLPGCDQVSAAVDFGRSAKVEQNQTEMQNAVERFVAESESAGDGSVSGIAQRLSSMRQYMLDLKQVVALKECAAFQESALSKMENVIETWSSIDSPDCNPGSFTFDSCMLRWRLDVSTKATDAVVQTSDLKSLADLGCSGE